MGRLAGKRVLVTAAGQGIGLASALAMANEGATVIATDINPDLLADYSHANISTMVVDVRNKESIADGVKTAEPDALFNCAGFVHHGTIQDATDDEWNFAF